MKKIKIAFLSLLATCTLASCDFLEKEPYKIVPENYFQNEAEAQSFLTGIYSNLGQSTFYGGDYMVLAGGDDLEFYGGSTGRISNTGLICNNTTTSDAAVTNLWLNLYNGIERANMFLEQIDNVPGMSDKSRLQYKSEARFLRAFYYFTLVQCWGDVPFKTESTYSSGTVTNKDIARTDKNVIYKFIVKEMEEAADEETGGLLSARELSYKPGRISKSTAWGISSVPAISARKCGHRGIRLPLITGTRLLICVPTNTIRLPMKVSGKLSLPETERETCVRKAVSETRSGFSVRTFLLYLML